MKILFHIEKTGEDGTRFEININFVDKEFHLYDIGVKPKGKRKYVYVCGSSMTDDYNYRRLSLDDKPKFKLAKMLEACPIELINQAFEEAWLSIKPKNLTK